MEPQLLEIGKKPPRLPLLAGVTLCWSVGPRSSFRRARRRLVLLVLVCCSGYRDQGY